MWNNTKGLPENYEFTLTSLYKFKTAIDEFMSSEGECIAHLKVGKFTLYMDVIGDAELTYKGKVYQQRNEITHSLSELIRADSSEVEWEERNEVRFGLELEDDGYSGIELHVNFHQLPNPLELEVMMGRFLVDSLYYIERNEVESAEGVVGLAHLLTDEDRDVVALLENRKTSTSLMPWETNPGEAVDDVCERLMMKNDLANVVAMVNVYSQYDQDANEYQLTVSWSSANEAVDREMRLLGTHW